MSDDDFDISDLTDDDLVDMLLERYCGGDLDQSAVTKKADELAEEHGSPEKALEAIHPTLQKEVDAVLAGIEKIATKHKLLILARMELDNRVDDDDEAPDPDSLN